MPVPVPRSCQYNSGRVIVMHIWLLSPRPHLQTIMQHMLVVSASVKWPLRCYSAIEAVKRSDIVQTWDLTRTSLSTNTVARRL